MNYLLICVGYAWYMPDDIQRKMTKFSERGRWKMRQRRNFFFYLIYAVFKQFVPDFQNGEFILQQLRFLMHALRLVGGFSNQPIESHVVQASQKLIERFFKGMVSQYGDGFATWKAHQFLHLLRDSVQYGCRMDRNSAHIYESFHQNYKGLIHPGPKVHVQLRYVSDAQSFIQQLVKLKKLSSYLC